MALTDGLISSWRHNDGWGDQIGPNHGTPSGAIIDPTVKHIGSGSGFLDGFNDNVNYGNDSSFDVGNCTISLWMYHITVAWCYLLSKRHTSFNSYFFVPAGGGNLTFGLWSGAGFAQASSGAGAYSASTWTHVLASFDSSYVRLYIGGVLKDKIALTGTIVVSPGDFILGEYWSGGSNFHGNVDQMDFWDRALGYGADIIGSPAGGEVGDVYNGGAGLEFDGIILPRLGLGRGLKRGLGRGL